MESEKNGSYMKQASSPGFSHIKPISSWLPKISEHLHKIFLGGWEKGKKIGGKTLVLVPYHAAAVAKFG